MLGVDIGTTSTKAVLFTEKGEIIPTRKYWLSSLHTRYFDS